MCKKYSAIKALPIYASILQKKSEATSFRLVTYKKEVEDCILTVTVGDPKRRLRNYQW
ncbi:hypothetical protein FLK61_37000 [Paenalkalicoccus suaedae]|uniref:Uncharacterized protein n=1 Tax=Paenalkalicoccus suaedae TaxID=2592382 RepID=A0A859FGI1_9BACI|nr:hypothetical protein [Paenalkalicoccus suaedae]QKS72239.1 hypothetical protein FLK61_37000 [Paenalkalicoccus suaedae]